ncbi:hypothetical protein AB5I39_04970 [Sphingomonas sp. MMS24-J45]|uniref:hypothetical protein n=1 Tax=Sphingomonas sp. MMS24-J45 TaxID=3238806 RepID=UPI0038510CDA
MSHLLGGALAIALAAFFGWLVLRDFSRGLANFPKPYFTFAKTEQPKLFWSVTIFNFAIVLGLLAAGIGMATQ